MKKLNIKVLLLSFLTIASFASCSSDKDDMSQYDRLFRSTTVSVTEEALDAILTFSQTPNTDYYIVEVSSDSLYDDVAMGASSHSVVYGQDKSILKSPFTIPNLNSSSKYYARLKGVGNDGRESKWAYIPDYSFTTKSEQIMKSFTYLSTTATLNWQPNAALTRIEVYNEDKGVVEQTIDLAGNTTALTNGTYNLTKLNPETKYTINLYNNAVKRGYASFTTYAAVPDADHIVFLSAKDSISQHVVDSISALGGSSITFALKAGASYAYASTLTIPDGWSVNFYGIPGGSQPGLSIAQIEIGGTHSYLNFKNLNITKAPAGTTYLFNQTNACNVNSIIFDGCTISGIDRSLIRLQGSATKVIETLSINNCLVSKFGAGGYYFIHVDASSGAGKINNILISESTFYNFESTAQGFIQSKKTQMVKLAITDCTFDKIIGDTGRYFIEFGQTTSGATNGISITNCVFGATQSTTAKGGRYDASNLSITNCYATTDWVISANPIAFDTYSSSRTALFADPDNGDFHYKDNSFAGKKTCGDPRWRTE